METTIPERIGSGRAPREDYALRNVPPTWRYTTSGVTLSLFGGATAGFFFVLPAQLAASFGLASVLIALAYAVVVQIALNYVFVKTASRTGLDSDLMSRGLGLGFDGSAWTTIIYWVSWVVYFAIEGQIIGGALSVQTGLPQPASYIIIGAAFVPLVLYGMGFMVKFQRWTLLLFCAGAIALLVKVLISPNMASTGSFLGAHLGVVSAATVMGAVATYNGTMGNLVFTYTDMGRLLANKSSLARSRRSGPAWVASLPHPIFAYIVFGLLGVLLWAFTGGVTNPGQYFVSVLGIAGFLLVVLTQFRINLINAYSGSLALANFFSRLHFVPGRTFWAITMVVVGTALEFGNVLGNVTLILAFEGILLAAWLGVIFADLTVVRGRLRRGPDQGRWIEYRRAMLPRWNFTGVVPLAVATIVGAFLGIGGSVGLLPVMTFYVASFVAFFLGGGLRILLCLIWGTSNYQRREAVPWPRTDTVARCPLDQEVVSTSDLFPCPHHNKWICASDCMATRGCGEICTSRSSQELVAAVPLPPVDPSLAPVNERLAVPSPAPLATARDRGHLQGEGRPGQADPSH